jgi:endoglycosylceramidase
LGEKGIYSLIDGHQDAFSNQFCGEGFPVFHSPLSALNSTCPSGFSKQVNDIFGGCTPLKDYNLTLVDNLPSRDSCRKTPFYMFYNTPEVVSAFERLYHNLDGYQDKFFTFWEKVIDVLKNNNYVLGYDVLNEPALSNQFKDPYLILDHEKFDREVLTPFYKRFEKFGVKMFFEPPYFPDTMNQGNGHIFPVGF